MFSLGETDTVLVMQRCSPLCRAVFASAFALYTSSKDMYTLRNVLRTTLYIKAVTILLET